MTLSAYAELIDAVGHALPKSAIAADAATEHLKASLTWISVHMERDPPHLCDHLLKGSYGAAVEAVSLLSFSLVRPAVLSLRSHYELSLQFLYYKDHPIEWRNVLAFRAQPNLPAVNKKYLRENYAGFEKRFTILCKNKTRRDDDCYDRLSGIAHGTAINSISTATTPKELIESEDVVRQCIEIFNSTGEYLSDVYLSAFEGNWMSLPDFVRTSINYRFDTKNPRVELDF